MRALAVGLLLFGLFLLAACDGAEKKALRQLVQDITSPIPETQAAGQALQVISVLEQAQNLDSLQQCRAARDLYCAMFQMVSRQPPCTDASGFCNAVATAFYGGSFPPFGPTICAGEAIEQCEGLIGQERRLQRICIELRQRC